MKKSFFANIDFMAFELLIPNDLWPVYYTKLRHHIIWRFIYLVIVNIVMFGFLQNLTNNEIDEPLNLSFLFALDSV